MQLRGSTSNNADVTCHWSSITRPPRLPQRQTSDATKDTEMATDSIPSIGPNDFANNLSPILPCPRGSIVTGASPSPTIFAIRDPPITATHSERHENEEGNGSSFPPWVILVHCPEPLKPTSLRYTSSMPSVGGRFDPPFKKLSCSEFKKLKYIARPPRLPHRQTTLETPDGKEEAVPLPPRLLLKQSQLSFE
jgi:hypothetical protein